MKNTSFKGKYTDIERERERATTEKNSGLKFEYVCTDPLKRQITNKLKYEIIYFAILTCKALNLSAKFLWRVPIEKKTFHATFSRKLKSNGKMKTKIGRKQ